MAARPLANPRGQPADTPTRQNADAVRTQILDVLLSLNTELGLRFVAPDPRATPADRKEWAGQSDHHSRCNQIWTELQYQYHRGDIDAAVGEFRARAERALSSRARTPRPRANPHRDRDEAQARELQKLLRDVLVEHREQKPPRVLKKAASTGSQVSKPTASSRLPASSRFSAPKHRARRLPDEDSTSEERPKRPKSSRGNGGAKVSLLKASSDLDGVMARESFSAESMFSSPSRTLWPSQQSSDAKRRPSPTKMEESSFSFADRSANTSTTSLATASTSISAVFSAGEEAAASFETQATAEVPSQEQQRTNPKRSERASRAPPEVGAPGLSHHVSDAEPTLDELYAIWEAEKEAEQAAWEVEKAAASRPPRAPAVNTELPGSPSSSPSPQSETSPVYCSSWSGSLVDTLAEQEHVISGPGPMPPRARNILQERLDLVWPKFPTWLRAAPLAVAWEVCRVALHCDVDLSSVNGMTYDPSWKDQKKLWSVLYERPEFRRRAFPEKSPPIAWAAALESFSSRGQSIVLSATLDFNMAASGPLFILSMLPLSLDDSHRLSRRFGSDRFLEVLYPSPNSTNVPPALRGEDAREATNKWLARGLHPLVGRFWASFYTKDAGYKKPATDLRLGPESAKAVFKDRTYFFAIDGHDFLTASPRNSLPPKDQKITARTRLSVHRMLDWLLQIRKNTDQPYLKLFSRIALGLSKTYPTVTFEPNQIRQQATDLLSPTGNVMNDGVGLMSRSVAHKIQKSLGLTVVPCAVQGRLGSAKGMWTIDVDDFSGDDWIETYPSQRKWECDLSDPDHRTLEVRSHASELRSARLNLQFLPVLEDRSRDKALFRASVGDLLKGSLQTELESLRVALNRPIQHRQWVHENSTNRDARVRHGEVPFLGGIPDKDEETMNMMLDHGFDPKEQKYLQDLAWGLQKQKCETLKKKLNISVGRSAYVYMVVDFWGLLKEDEVHICFSNKFQVDDFADTLLDGIDVLVARSPAHYISDVQRVKAVFKPALKDLKDVIIFPRKGNVALADKLSGGDYDGDMAWVCWDQAIVSNFVSSPVPPAPDLFERGYLNKNKEKMKDLVREHGFKTATSEMIERSFLFNMRQNYLGICTNFKERLCYKRRNVYDEHAVLLSTLLSNLVDQSKQGIEFSAGQWRKLKHDLGEDKELDMPLYKEGNWTGVGEPHHIIDYLKFSVAKPLIDKELGAFYNAISSRNTARAPSASPLKARGGETAEDANKAHYYDEDLTAYFNWVSKMKSESKSMKFLLESLHRDICAVEKEWKMTMRFAREAGTGEGLNKAGGEADFRSKVLEVYDAWCKIEPDRKSHKELANSKLVAILEQDLWAREDSPWALLRASAAFKNFYRTSPKFVWRMAGRQLCRLKSLAVGRAEGPAMAVVPGMYVALRPDGRIIKQLVAREEESGSQYTGVDDDDYDDDDDDGSDYRDDGWD